MVKHHVIFEALHKDILQGRYSHGNRLPSEEALCRKWQVSRPTVARALHELNLLGLIERRAGSGTYVTGNIHTVRPILGLFVEGLGQTEILDPICAEITRAAQERGCSIFTSGHIADRAVQDVAADWVKNGIRGVFFAPFEKVENREEENLAVAHAFEMAGMSIILIDRDARDFPNRSSYDLVAMDSFHAGCELGRHLASLSCARIAFIAKLHYPSTTDLRLSGLRTGVGGASVDFRMGDPEDIHFVEQIVRTLPKYDAVVCSNDLTAAQFLQTATRLKVRIPNDFKLAGFDDVRYATLLSVPLTTVRQPCREIGIAAIDAMLGRLERPKTPPRTILLHGELMTRDSTS